MSTDVSTTADNVEAGIYRGKSAGKGANIQKKGA
jgi:hypothetical protein